MACVDQCNGYQQTVSTLGRAAGLFADHSSAGTAACGRPASASADRSTSTDLVSSELLVSPDLASAGAGGGGGAADPAVFRPIRRPYGGGGTVSSSQDEEFSYFDTEDDDDDDDLRYRGQSLHPRVAPACSVV